MDWLNQFGAENPRATLPLYCETPTSFEIMNGLISVPYEVWNTLTSFVPFGLGLTSLYMLYRQKQYVAELVLLATLFTMVGLGSVLWHGLRTPVSLTVDWVPGVVFLLIALATIVRYLKGRWWAFGIIPGTIGLSFLCGYVLAQLLPPFVGGPMGVFAAVFLVTHWLWYEIWCRLNIRKHWFLMGGVIYTALVAAAARVADQYVCGSTLFPDGSHYLWHVFLGTSAFLSMLLLIRLRNGIEKKGEM